MLSERDLIELKREVVRSVTYRESLIMQLNALVLNWPSSSEHGPLDSAKNILKRVLPVSLTLLSFCFRVHADWQRYERGGSPVYREARSVDAHPQS